MLTGAFIPTYRSRKRDIPDAKVKLCDSRSVQSAYPDEDAVKSAFDSMIYNRRTG
jgi:hypothetical protein